MRAVFSLAALALSTSALAADLYVETNGQDTGDNDCTNAVSPCATLEHALQEADSNGDATDNVYVGVGTFNSDNAYPLYVPNGVSLQGAGSGVGGTGLEPTANYIGSASAILQIHNNSLPTTVKGLAIRNAPQKGIQVIASGSMLGSLGFTDVAVSDAHTGLAIFGAGSGSLTTVIDGSTFEDYARTGLYLNWTGEGALDVTLTNNTLSNTLDSGAEGADLHLAGNSGANMLDATVTLAGNNFLSNDAYGLRLIAHRYVDGVFVLDDNTFEGTGCAQLCHSVGNDNTIDLTVMGNTFQNGEDHGLSLSVGNTNFFDVRFADNTVVGNEGDGVHFYLEDNNTVTGRFAGNTLAENTGNGMYFEVQGSANVVSLTLKGNTVDDNEDAGLELRSDGDGHNALHYDIVGNTITNTDGQGVDLQNWGEMSDNVDVDLRFNVIEDNAEDGVRITNSYGALTGRFYGNVIRGNEQNGVFVERTWYPTSVGPPGIFLELRHNTIQDNATATSATYWDFNNIGNEEYAVLAYDNWWGTTDRGVIDTHIYDHNDNGDLAEVLYTALDATLDFTVFPPTGPVDGGTVVAIHAADGAPPFVPTVGAPQPTGTSYPGDLPLEVSFDATPATDLSVTPDGRTLYAVLPAHAVGTIGVTVTNPGGQTGTVASAFEYLAVFVDDDADGVEDGTDNCVGVANADQLNHDTDADGDACDDDDDGDGVLDGADNCPTVANDDQADLDDDGDGNACDDDDDDDSVDDAIDNCPNVEGEMRMQHRQPGGRWPRIAAARSARSQAAPEGVATRPIPATRGRRR